MISEAVTSAVTANFEYAEGRYRDTGFVPGPPAFGLGPVRAGHGASRAPAVPEPLLDIDYDSATPGVIFTWKAEYDDPPYVILRVPPHWRRDVVNCGWVVLDGYPVLQVTGHDSDGRPSEVLAVAVTGHYDASMHGWRADGIAVTRDVAWASDGTCRLINQGTGL